MAFHNNEELNPFEQEVCYYGCYFGVNLYQRGMNYNVGQMSVGECTRLPPKNVLSEFLWCLLLVPVLGSG